MAERIDTQLATRGRKILTVSPAHFALKMLPGLQPKARAFAVVVLVSQSTSKYKARQLRSTQCSDEITQGSDQRDACRGTSLLMTRLAVSVVQYILTPSSFGNMDELRGRLASASRMVFRISSSLRIVSDSVGCRRRYCDVDWTWTRNAKSHL